MKAFSLYARYALRSFVRGRSRSLFGAFCVAVGITSVVSLGLVGGNFRDAVTGNAQKQNRGDVSVQFPGQGITRQDLAYFDRLKAQGKITAYTTLLQADALVKRAVGEENNVVIGGPIAVDAARFPFYDTITANDPAGVPLSRLIRGPGDAVTSQTVLSQLHLHVGDRVHVVMRFGGQQYYTIRGVVPDNAPSQGFGAGLFPYWVMVDNSSMRSYMAANNIAANQVFIKTAGEAQAAAVKAGIERQWPLTNPKTVADVQKDAKNGADGFDKFFRMMGLVAVVIGGIGIINTMLVAARRRSREIAVLKAIGMKSRQVIVVFTLEAVVLAVLGTALGIVGGIFVSMLVNSVTQGMAGYPIPWSLHTGPILAGVLVGIVGTVLFSYLPVVRASRARPVAALRSDMESPFGGRGFRSMLRRVFTGQSLRTGLLVLLLAAVMGYLGVLYTGLFAGPKTLLIGVAVGLGTLIAAGVLTQVFVLLVWLASRLPSLGRLPLRMALRSMRTQKRRLGSTMLALCIGILAIGSIAILAQNIKHEFAQSLEKHQNFNVIVQVPHNPRTVANMRHVVSTLPGISQQVDGDVANQLILSSVNGVPINALVQQALAARNKDGSAKYGKDTIQQAIQNVRTVAARNHVGVPAENYVMNAGRNLNATDSGTNHVVIDSAVTDPFHIKVGSKLMYAENGRQIPFTVVGIADDQSNFMVLANTAADLKYMQRMGLTVPSPSHHAVLLLNIDHSSINADVAAIRQKVPGALVLDLNAFLEFTKVIDKLALFPEIIGALALFAGAIIIANTVALAMLERRREIGVMKAVGARRRTILQFLLVENAIVGFIGAGVGVLLAMFATYMVDTNLFHLPASYDPVTIVVLVALGMALAIVASSLTALPASSEKPMTVLRYE